MEGNNIFKSKLVWVMVAVAVISIAIIVALVAASNASDDMNETPSGDIVDLNETTDNTTSGGETTGQEDSTTGRENDTTGDETTDDRGYVGDEGVNGDKEDQTSGLMEEVTNDLNDAGEDVRNDVGDIVGDVRDDLAAGVFPTEELFANTRELQWPVMGNIILDFSMDKTVYFPTLDVYKVNAGIMIQSEVGTEVVAAATGSVKEVGFNEEIGNYIVIDMGEGYAATYGQIENISLKSGDKVAKGDKIGTVAEPTKYYSVEGCNVYFRLDKDDKPIDPVEFFSY